MSMQLSCVILNYNDAETTEKLVKRLRITMYCTRLL